MEVTVMFDQFDKRRVAIDDAPPSGATLRITLFGWCLEWWTTNDEVKDE